MKAKIMGVPTGLPADVVKSLDDVETDRLVRMSLSSASEFETRQYSMLRLVTRQVDSSETGEATTSAHLQCFHGVVSCLLAVTTALVRTEAKKSSRQSKRDVVGEGCGTGAQEKQRARKKRKKKPKPKPVADVEAVGLE